MYTNAYLELVAKDKDVPREVLLRIANTLTSSINPSVAKGLLNNPTVKQDREILKIIVDLPIYSGDAYAGVRNEANILLSKL